MMSSDSETDEPCPEALARYLAMRRHTVGVGDSKHEAPEDPRLRLAHHQPIAPGAALPLPSLYPPIPGFNLPPHFNFPHYLMPMGCAFGSPIQAPSADSNLLRPPQLLAPSEFHPSSFHRAFHLIPLLLCSAADLGRRASDGGANIHLFAQQFFRPVGNISRPGSQEGQSPVSDSYLCGLFNLGTRFLSLVNLPVHLNDSQSSRYARVHSMAHMCSEMAVWGTRE